MIVLNVFDPFEEEVVIRLSQKWKFSTEFLGYKSFPIGYFENSYDPEKSPQWFRLEADPAKSSEPVQGEINLVFEYTSLETRSVISAPTGSFHRRLTSHKLTPLPRP